MSGSPERFEDLLKDEAGHAYAWGGGSLVLVVVLVLLLIWLL